MHGIRMTSTYTTTSQQQKNSSARLYRSCFKIVYLDTLLSSDASPLTNDYAFATETPSNNHGYVQKLLNKKLTNSIMMYLNPDITGYFASKIAFYTWATFSPSPSPTVKAASWQARK